MKIHREFTQRSVEWMNARAGIPTASEFDNLVSPTFEIRKGEMPRTYLAKKLAEKWLGGGLAGFNTFDMDQGRILEEQAIPFYELTYEEKIEQVGLITTDDGRVACSPDGLFDDGTGIEIKCPLPQTHCGYLMANVLPKEYAAQVHGSMFVADAPSWKFFSYCRNFPPFMLTIERDEEIQEAIQVAVHDFLVLLDMGFERLCDLNGGPPRWMRQKEVRQAFADADGQRLFRQGATDDVLREFDVSIP